MSTTGKNLLKICPSCLEYSFCLNSKKGMETYILFLGTVWTGVKDGIYIYIYI